MSILKRKYLKAAISAALAVCMLLSMCPAAFAQYEDEDAGSAATSVALLESLEEMELEAEESGAEYDGYIFKLNDNALMTMSAFDADDDSSIAPVDYSDGLYTADSTDEIFESIDASQIEYIEPNYIVELFDDMGLMSSSDPNDRYYQDGSQWNLDIMNVPTVWEYGLEGQSISDDKSVVVAVIDSGINHDHQDLDDTHVLEGYSYVTTNTSNTSDTLGHGSFCAGQIFATKDNEVGIAGMMPQVYIMPLRVFGSSNRAYTSDIIAAINYAVASGEVDVISMSLGGEGSSTAMENACKGAVENGILVVAAAGNDGDYTPNYPAAYDCVIGVGSIGSDTDHYEVSYFSQRGTQNVFCVAPGFKLVSTYYDDSTSYYKGSGTSFACPEVAALGAMVKSIDRSINQDQFKELIISTSKDLGDTGRDKIYGYGLIDFKAVAESLINTTGDDSTVSFLIENENGETVENAALRVFKYGETDEIEPGADGSYTLEKGRYSYKVTADKYQTAEGSFSVITGSRTVRIILEGIAYPVGITARNTNGTVLDNAYISVVNSRGREFDAIEYGRYELKNGTYTYSISATGYYTQTGSFTVADGAEEIDVTVYGDIDVASAKLNIIDADGERVNGVSVEIYNADGGQVEPYSDGYYKLYPGDYTYIAQSTNYLTENGKFTIGEEQKGTIISVDIPMLNPVVWVYFEVVPINAAISVWNSQNELVEAEAAGEYKLLKGTYTYEISADGYTSVRDSFTISTKGLTIDIELSSKDDDGFTTVTFISNGGSYVEARRVKLGEKLEEPETPKKSGYDFAGWYKEASLTTPWNFDVDIVTGASSLYAKWTPHTYNIIYMYGDQVLENLQPSTHVYGTSVKELPVPVIDGQRFMYWCSDAALKNKVTSIPASKASDAVLYAYCEADSGSYTVSFDSNGGSDVESVVADAESGYLAARPADPEKTGYSFTGWYSDPELTKLWNFETDTVDWNMTLYAAWEAKEYRIIYMSGDTEQKGLQPDAYTYNEDVYQLPIPESTDADKVFSGWYSDEACTVKQRNIPAGSIGDIVLYAGWSEKKTSVPDDCDYVPDEDGNYPSVDAEGYTLIYNQEQLEGLRSYLVSSSEARAMKAAGTIPKFRLAQSIMLKGEWLPIGSGNNFFCGEFDGAGHTIAGLYINSTDSYQALFGKIYASTVSNLELYGSVSGGGVTAALAGEVYDTGFYNCIVDVTVKCTATGAGTAAGGIVATISGGSIVNCANLGSVSREGSVSSDSIYATGGILGMTTLFSSSEVTVSGCYNSGSVTSSSGTPTGGIVGTTYNSSASIINCYNTGDVTQSGTTNAHYGSAAGIVGLMKGGGTIKSCYSIGSLSSSQFAAGITAYTVKPTVSDAFYLEGTSENGGYKVDEYSHTASELGETFDYSADYDYSAVIESLGSAYDADTDGSLNAGYPVLAWQYKGSSYEFSIEVKDSITGNAVNDAVITVDGEQLSDGSTMLEEGFHSYSVEMPGYETISSIFYQGRMNRKVVAELYPVYYQYTFKVSPENAAFTLRNDVFGVIEPESTEVADGYCTYVFRLARSSIYGSYAYSAVKYGFGTVNGNVDVTQQGSLIVGMSVSEYKEIRFEVIPVSAALKVTDADGNEIAPYEDRVYHLVEGSYSYELKADGYYTVRGKVTVPGSTTVVSVVMELNTGWDGTSDTDWYNEDDSIYYIYNAEQLSGFRDLCNGGNTFAGKTIVLAADINLKNRSWTPIGKYTYGGSTSFQGTFDGADHTISGLNLSSSQAKTGFFASIYKGTVRNLTIEGTVTGANEVGGFAGHTSGATFENCISNINVSSTGYKVGGLVGYAEGSLKTSLIRCINNGDVTSTSSYTGTAAYAVGGIIGAITGGSAEVMYCRNNGRVSGSVQSVGGIVGDMAVKSTVSYCFNNGEVSASAESAYCGGLVGVFYGSAYGTSYNQSVFNYNLNLGVVSSDSQYTGGLVGYNHNKSSLNQNYYFYTSAEYGIGSTDDSEDCWSKFGNEQDNEYEKTLYYLSEGFALQGGSFILKWENSSSLYQITMTVKYDTSTNRTASDKPVFTLRNDSEEFVVPSTGIVQLPNGTYYYTAGQNGYDDATGSFVVASGDMTVTVPLKATRYDLAVTFTPDNAAMTLKNSTGTLQEPVSSEAGEIHYGLLNGTYEYTLEAYGYETASGSVTISYAKESLPLELKTLDQFEVSFNFVPESGEFTQAPVMTIYQNNLQIAKVDGTEQSTVTLASGVYKYIVRAKGFATTSGEFTVTKSETIAIPVSLSGSGVVSDTVWYYENPEAESFNISNLEELYGLAELVNSGEEQFEGKTINLIENISMNGGSWTPIGKWDGTHFRGSFNGNGHSIVISNGSISGTEFGFGLFGYIEGASISDLILRGSIDIRHDSESDTSVIVYVGSLAGYASGSVIERVSNQLNVSVNASVGSAGVLDVGGIVGWAGGNSKIDSCYNIGAVTANISSLGIGSNNICIAQTGGICGYAVAVNASTSYVSITNSYNTGAVSCSASNIAKAAGITAAFNSNGSAVTMKNCYNTGKITASSTSTSEAKALYTGSASGAVINNYYLKGCAESAAGYSKSEDEMKSAEVAEALGDAYSYVEGRFPKLKWEKTAGSIEIGSMPAKLVYNDFEDFDDSGMSLVVTYEDGSSEEISSGWTVLNGRELRVNMNGPVSESSTQADIVIEFKGVTTTLPITVNQVKHIIPNSELSFEIPVPKAGEKAEELTFSTEKYTAAVTWTQAGKSFTGVFEPDTFYRAKLSVKAKYVTGEVWYCFESKSAASIPGVFEILYKSVKAEKENDNAMTALSAELTYKATGERSSDFDQKALHLYYEGDSNSIYFFDKQLDSYSLSITAGDESVSYTLRQLEKKALAGAAVESDYCRYNGKYRSIVKLAGISMYDLCRESGLFADNLSDASVVSVGGKEYTWGQIRSAGNSYDAEGKLTAEGLGALVAFGANGVPFGTDNGLLQGVRPMQNPMDDNSSQWALNLSSISLTGAEYLSTHKLRLAVSAEDGADISSILEITIRDDCGHVIAPVDGVYLLNEGQSYSYSIGAKGYGTQNGKTEPISGDTVLSITLVKTWDGVTITEPELNSDGFYLIYSAEELMWFDLTEQKESNNARLMADITLNSDGEYVNKWQPMNTSETRTGYFTGTFDGNGHTIHNLYMQLENLYTIEVAYDGTPMLLSSRQDNLAMFGYLGGTVKNLGVTGRMEILDRPDSNLASWMQIGVIAAYMSNNAVISGCYTDVDVIYNVGKETTVTGGYPDCGFPEYCDVYVGGIVGSISKGSVENCYSTGSIYAVDTRRVNAGGIAGGLRSSAASISYCYSTCAITAIPGEMSGSGMISGVGGIVGDITAVVGGDNGSVKGCFALNDRLECAGSQLSSSNRIVGLVDGTPQLSLNYGNEAMEINAGTHDDGSKLRSSVNGGNINLAKAKESLTPYTSVGWTINIWKSDDESSLPSFLWQKPGTKTVNYSITINSDNARVNFTGGVVETDDGYTTTNNSTVSFTIEPDAYLSVDTVTVTGGKLSSAGGYYTVRSISGELTITVTTKPAYGDVNGDGRVNALDAMLILRYLAHYAELSEAQLACADVDGSGTVNSTDARLILQYSVGAVEKLPFLQ